MKNVQVRAGYVLHIGNIEGTLKVGDKVKLYVDGVCSSSFFLELNMMWVLNTGVGTKCRVPVESGKRKIGMANSRQGKDREIQFF